MPSGTPPTPFVLPPAQAASLPPAGQYGRRLSLSDGDRREMFDKTTRWIPEGAIDVRRFGTGGRLSEDATAAIQAALDVSVNGSRIYLPAGDYNIAASLVSTTRQGLTIFGDGDQATRIRWTGAAGIPVLKLTNHFRSNVRDLAIWGNTGFPPSALIESEIDTNKPITGCGALSVRDVQLGNGPGDCLKGIAWTKSLLGDDQNNDLSQIQNVYCPGASLASFSFEHSESKGHSFIDCYATGGECGVSTAYGNGGSFNWEGGFLGSHTVADFCLASPNDAIQIHRTQSEGSKRLLATINGGSAIYPVTIGPAVRFAVDGLHADGFGIIFQLPGPLTVRGNVLCQDPAKQFKISVDCAAPGVGRLYLDGNGLGAAATNPVLNVSGRFTLVDGGNLYIDGSGNAIEKTW